MSVNEKSFLDLAKSDIRKASGETEFRCIVNRAYYSAYHQSKKLHSLLPAPGILPLRPVGVHERLIHQLLHPSFAKSISESQYNLSLSVGYILKGIKVIRSKADYNLNALINISDATSAITQSESIFSKK